MKASTLTSRPRHTTRAAGVVVAAAVVALTAALGPALPWRLADHSTAEKHSFSLSGNVDGLYPGAALPLRVTVTNPDAFDIDVTNIDVTVSGTNRCSAHNVVVAPFSGSVRIAKRATAVVPLTVTFSSTAPNECQGESFGLHYTAIAQKADHK